MFRRRTGFAIAIAFFEIRIIMKGDEILRWDFS